MNIHFQGERARQDPASGLGLVPLLVALVLLGSAAACGGAVSGRLRDSARAHEIPADLTVVYDDYHPTWGGERIVVRGDRSIQVRRWRPGQSEDAPTSWRGRIPEPAMSQLVTLLVEIEAWEQRGDGGPPRIDDARARLETAIGRERESIWEWANDLQANRRIVRVKQHLDALAFEARHPMAP